MQERVKPGDKCGGLFGQNISKTTQQSNLETFFSPKMNKENTTTEAVLRSHVNQPTIAWKLVESSQVVSKLTPKNSNSPKPPGHTRFVCISDTHNKTDRMQHPIPKGDVLIHAGDFTSCGTRDQVKHFNSFMGSLRHPYKVVIAGNHDISFDIENYESLWSFFSRRKDEPAEIRQLLTNCIYLEDSEVDILGFRIFGSPW